MSLRQAFRILFFYQDKISFCQDKMSKVAGCKRKLESRTINEKEIQNTERSWQRKTICIHIKGIRYWETYIVWRLKEKTKIYSEVEKYKILWKDSGCESPLMRIWTKDAICGFSSYSEWGGGKKLPPPSYQFFPCNFYKRRN